MNTEYQVQAGHYTFDEAKRKFAFLTKSEAEKMLRETEYHFDKETREGVFTYPDGREIRLPANGYIDSHERRRRIGDGGDYWLMDDKPKVYRNTHAWNLSFHTFCAYLDYHQRTLRFSVWGIEKKKSN